MLNTREHCNAIDPTTMRLYHLTTAPPLAGTALALGAFSGSKKQELVVASGTHLHLYRQLKNGLLHPTISAPVFGVIRALGVFRLPGTSRDFVAVTSDAGVLTVLGVDRMRGVLKVAASESFGRSGMRRTVPGEYLACDPHGRALMVAAIERQKFVYVLGRDDNNALLLSSPLEAHKSATATHALVALDVGFGNPVFAAIERAYEGEDAHSRPSLSLVYYELDLGLNHVVRKHASPVRADSYLLLAVPGDDIGPGGVLVCSSGYVTYRHLFEEDEDGNLQSRDMGNSGRPKRIEARMPLRKCDAKQEPRMVVCGTLMKHKTKRGTVFFFMLCTEVGDLIRVDIIWNQDDGATELRMAYFETLPGPALDIRILRSGYMFVMMEGGDSLFLRFERSDAPEDDPNGGFSTSIDNNIESTKLCYVPREKLTYLALNETVPSFGPVLAMHSGDFTGEGASQLVMATGRGSGGALRVVRSGLATAELTAPRSLSGASVNGMYSFKEREGDDMHKYVIISMAKQTNILRVENDSLTPLTSTIGFRTDCATLCAQQMGVDSFVQMYTKAVRFVPSGNADRATEWSAPHGVRVVNGVANNTQALAALSNGTVVYFEISARTGTLTPVEEIEGALAVAGDDIDITRGAADADARPSLALPVLSAGRTRAQFFAVGDGATQKVSVYKIGTDGTPQRAGLHVAPAPISSVGLVDFGDIDRDVLAAASGTKLVDVVLHPPKLTLLIGTKHGALVTLGVDRAAGSLSDKRTMFLGAAPINLMAFRMLGVPACVVMAARPWLYFPQGIRPSCVPLCTSGFQFAAPFDMGRVRGIAAVSTSRLRILSLPAVESVCASAALPVGLAPACAPALTRLNATSLCTRSAMSGTPRRVIPLFSLAKGGGGFGEAPRRGATGVDVDCADMVQQTDVVKDEGMSLFAVVECDHRAKFVEEAERGEGGGEKRTTNGTKKKVEKRGRVVAGDEGEWASQLRLVGVRHIDKVTKGDESGDESDGESAGEAPSEAHAVCTLDAVRLRTNESALCAVASRVMDADSEVAHVVLSVSRNFRVNATGRRPRAEGAEAEKVENELKVYRVDRRERTMRFVHSTPVEEGEPHCVRSMTAFRDMVAVGVGRTVRLYQLGRKRLLRKGELRHAVRNKISTMCTIGGVRLFVGDAMQSVTVCDYGALGWGDVGRLSVVARDTLSRWTTCVCVVDYNTVCVGDKFGNICILRVRDGPLGASAHNDAPKQLSVEACVHIGATVTSMYRSGSAIRYGTAHGARGALLVIETESEAALLRSVERWCGTMASVVGRDHTKFRSTFYALKNVIDGDICEIAVAKQESLTQIASQVGRRPEDVVRCFDEARWRIESE